ncbi:S8 family serine peptidase [Streptococcus ruminantium]|uniref:S8 family serine peptidase n=1 Tax=Streptococcus ruminantium TaxID=1917441 RepID=UPI0012DBE4C3|nr:S8 family serine peptidase [Streptococcus ruminantium]
MEQELIRPRKQKLILTTSAMILLASVAAAEQQVMADTVGNTTDVTVDYEGSVKEETPTSKESREELAQPVEEEIKGTEQPVKEVPATANQASHTSSGQKTEKNKSSDSTEKENKQVLVTFEKTPDESVKKAVLALAGEPSKHQFDEIINGLSVGVPKEKLAEIQGLKGVKHVQEINAQHNIHPNPKELKHLNDQARTIREQRKAERGTHPLDGRGLVIATIDSGIDKNHEIMRLDDDIKEENLKIKEVAPGYSRKIPFAFDFMSGDNDLLDERSEHGMHIAGVLVGNKDNGFKGMAPNAQLLAYRTWSYANIEGFQEDHQFFALEDAIKRGADVVSLSIGSDGSGQKGDAWYEAFKRAAEKGIIVTAAMGNTGSANTTNTFDRRVDSAYPQKDESATVAVAANPYVLGVGSYYHTHMQLPHLKVGDLDLPYEDINWHNYTIFGKKDHQEFKAQGELHDLEESPNADLKDKIVLVRRDEEDLLKKLTGLMHKNAKGIILINAPSPTTLGNYETIPEIRSTLLDDYKGQFQKTWAVSVSEKDGERLKEYIKKQAKQKKEDLLFQTKPILTKVFDHPGISGFSSWGSSGTMEMKPDVVAPGENVYSTGNWNSYFNMSGTSMSSPYVAGASAMLLPHTKDLLKKGGSLTKGLSLPELNKILLQNTADVLLDHTVPKGKDILEYSPRRQGAGAVNAEKALKTKVLVTYDHNKGAASLKDFEDKKKEFSLVMKNLSDEEQIFVITPGQVLGKTLYSHERKMYGKTETIQTTHTRKIDGANLQVAKIIRIAPKSQAVIPVTLEVGGAQKNEFVEGYIYFQSLNPNQPNLNIPYTGFYGNWNDEKIVDPPAWEKDSKTKMTGFVKGYATGHEVFDYVPWGTDYEKWKEDPSQITSDPNLYVLQSKGGISDNAKMRLRLMTMRHAQELVVEVVDSKDESAKTLKVLKRGHYPLKFLNSAHKEKLQHYIEPYNDPDMDLDWGGTVFDPKKNDEVPLKEGQYYIRIRARLEEHRPWQYTYIPFKIDNTSPTITVKEKTDDKVVLDIQDPNLHQVLLKKDSETVKVIERSSDGYYHVEKRFIDDKVELVAVDYGDNKTVFDLEKLEVVESNENLGGYSYRSRRFNRPLRGYGFATTDEDDVEEDEEDNLDDTTSEEDDESEQDEDSKAEETDYDDDDDDDDDEKSEREEDPTKFESGSDFHDGDNTLGYLEGNRSGKIWDDDDDETGQYYRTYHLHVKKGQRVIITNTNPLYNVKKGNTITAPTWSETYEYDQNQKEYHKKIRVPVFEGSNQINVTVYHADKKIFARGYAVKLDSQIPKLTIDNKNVTLPIIDDNDDEQYGIIPTPDGKVRLSGTIEDGQEGWKLYINGDMIDSTLKKGEFGDFYHHNKRQWFYEKQLEDGDYVSIKVSDHLKNTRTYTFKVKVDTSAKHEELVQPNPETPSIKNVDTFTNDLNVDSLFDGFKGEGITTPLALVKELSRLAPDHSIQLLNLALSEKPDGLHVARVQVQKGNQYQQLDVKWFSVQPEQDKPNDIMKPKETPAQPKKPEQKVEIPEKPQLDKLSETAPKVLKQAQPEQGEKVSLRMELNRALQIQEGVATRGEASSKASTKALPQTGESSNLFLVGLGVVLAGFTGLYRKKKKKQL